MTGREKDLVTVEAGNMADMSNLRNLHRVIKGGVIHDYHEISK
jgi:hypothetical protein